MSGWIKLHRDLADWEWYDDHNTTRLFIHCILKANHKPNKWRGIDIQRGQFYTSLDTLSSEIGLSVMQLRTCFKKLNSTGEVTSSGMARGRMITVANYTDYQEDNRLNDRVVTGLQQGSNRVATTNKNDKNEKNENKGSRFAPPELTDVKEYFSTKGVNGGDAERFFDHFTSNGWKVGGKAAMKDWKAAVRTWIGRNQPQQTTTEVFL